jgi:hypothetical protein
MELGNQLGRNSDAILALQELVYTVRSELKTESLEREHLLREMQIQQANFGNAIETVGSELRTLTELITRQSNGGALTTRISLGEHKIKKLEESTRDQTMGKWVVLAAISTGVLSLIGTLVLAVVK